MFRDQELWRFHIWVTKPRKSRLLATTPALRIVLEDDAEMLDDVVVIGYGVCEEIRPYGFGDLCEI